MAFLRVPVVVRPGPGFTLWTLFEGEAELTMTCLEGEDAQGVVEADLLPALREALRACAADFREQK